MDLFGQASKGKGVTGNWETTAAMSRTNILAAMPFNGSKRLYDLLEDTKISEGSVSQHCSALETAGLVTKKSVLTNEGRAITGFIVTKQGNQLDEWPIYFNSQGYPSRTDSERVFEAIRLLSQREESINSESVTTYIDQTYGQGPKSRRGKVTLIMSHLAKKRILEHTDFHYGKFSDISLTALGNQVADEVILPLILWSDDPYAVGEINEIRKNLERNPHAYDNLFPQIAENFVLGSHQKNADPQSRQDEVLKMVRTESGSITQRDIARQLNLSYTAVHKVVLALTASSTIALKKSERGSKIFLVATQ